MAEEGRLKVAILIVSDTAARDSSTDRTMSVLRDVLENDSHNWELAHTDIVPDDASRIQEVILPWTDGSDHVSLVVTSGGTGFATRDITPETVSPLIDRHAPGLVHAMLAASLAITPFAMMARPVAGVRKTTLIITLPGSPKGAAENLQAVIKLLPHACHQVAGMNSRSLHSGGIRQLEKEAGVTAVAKDTSSSSHTHTHCHHSPTPHTLQSNDLSSGPTRRHRSSPYPIIPVSEALSIILAQTPSPSPIVLPTANLSTLINHVIASPVYAPCGVPAFRASLVDGYALSVPQPSWKQSTAGTFPVISLPHPTTNVPSTPRLLQPGEVARITTGSPLPPGANAICMVEDTLLHSTHSPPLNEFSPDSSEEESHITILPGSIAPGAHIREPGSDIPPDSLLLPQGAIISALGGEIGLLAAAGIRAITVYARPRIGVLSTGDELVSANEAGELPYGRVRDTNRPTLLAAVAAAGFQAIDLGIAPDTATGLEHCLKAGLSRCDVLITSGGVSMGEKDLLKPVVERKLGGSVWFGRVGIKPGKPTTFMTIPSSPSAGDARDTPVDGDDSVGDAKTKLVFALPGNPASALVTFQVLVRPCLDVWSGVPAESAGPRHVRARMLESVRRDPARVEYVRVAVGWKDDERGEAGCLWARTTGGQRSSRVGSMAGGNGLVVVQPGMEDIAVGASVACLLLSQIGTV